MVSVNTFTEKMENKRVIDRREIVTVTDSDTGIWLEETVINSYVVIGSKKIWVPPEIAEEISDEMSKWDIIYTLEKERKMKMYLNDKDKIVLFGTRGDRHECTKYQINCYEDLKSADDYNMYIIMFQTNDKASQIFIGTKQSYDEAKKIAENVLEKLDCRKGNLLTKNEIKKVRSGNYRRAIMAIIYDKAIYDYYKI